jgi:hypothetical protein
MIAATILPLLGANGDPETRTIDPGHFFPTLDAAIAAFRQQTGANWTHASGG